MWPIDSNNEDFDPDHAQDLLSAIDAGIKLGTKASKQFYETASEVGGVRNVV